MDCWKEVHIKCEMVNAETEAYCEGLEKSYFTDGINKREKHSMKCIELEGDYILIQ